MNLIIYYFYIVSSTLLKIENGMITTYTKCNLTINQKIHFFDVYNKTLPNLYYGVVEFNCLKSDSSIHYGYQISTPICKDCGVYCRFNDLIPKCRNSTLPIFMGCLMLLCIASFFFCFYKELWKNESCLRNYIRYRSFIKKDTDTCKDAFRTSKVLKVSSPLEFEQPTNLSNYYRNKLRDKRIAAERKYNEKIGKIRGIEDPVSFESKCLYFKFIIKF